MSRHSQPVAVRRNQPCDCGHPDAYWHDDPRGLREFMCVACWTARQHVECITALYGVVMDVMPQLGGIVLQNYERLNRGLMLAEAILQGNDRERIAGTRRGDSVKTREASR